MPAVCSIVQCGARKNKNLPQLTVHRFPRNEVLKKKWLKAIGSLNINTRHTQRSVCSLHFEKSCFNTTLDVIRLHDNSVPTIFCMTSDKQRSSILCEKSNLRETNVSPPSSEIVEESHEEKLRCTELSSSIKLQRQHLKEKRIQTEKIKRLTEKCILQQQKIKQLNEKVRNQNKKIANLKDILQNLRNKNNRN